MTTPPRNDLILNVDDNEGGRYAKSRLLKLAGYRVIEAATGQEALDAAAREQPSLMLLDVMLPDINGMEVCRRIKEDPVTGSIIVLQTSASAVQSRDRVKAFDGGADSYLIEPIEPEELIANVRALLRMKAAEDAHRTAEAALRESEERFRQMAEAIGDVFWVYEPTLGEHVYVSKAIGSVWGVDDAAVLANPDLWWSPVHADDRERVRTALDVARTTGSYDEEYRLQHADGRIAWIHDRGFPIRGADGAITRLTGVAHDITDRRAAAQALVDADRRKDEFLAMLAHELRNPLAPIRNAVELMRLIEPSATGVQMKAREIISRQVDHLSRLVDELLDVSRITHGKISLVREPVALSTVVRAASEAVRPLMDQRKHAFTAVMPMHELWLSADPVRLAQVLGNLLNNAAKYTPMGGEITLTAEQHGDRMHLSVRDNGIGIAADTLPHVFDLFMQADPSLDRSQGGLGLGLSLAQTLAHMHDGQITAKSGGAGNGSVFTLDLPLGAPGPRASTDPAAIAGHPTSRRILIVEDNADAAEGMALLLGERGHIVTVALDGVSGLETARRLQPEVIILDIGLPLMDGYQLARELRASPATSRAVLVALSGYGQAADKLKSRSAGIDFHLVKPTDLASLEAVIDHLPEQPV
ncbi:hypothetical protein GCM10007242_46700 [Pigmentiphaga litoralis]|uniref:hybrid sensor histidine kinase/response regulator n=1 Tax=Pigmentiphaga litoralis TaxID=516702 RepID=UPI00167298BD|nr:response regulator [Pigmentiphaga litoralis]GGX34479.1 hypothetical protein GCM10007242_46700 [Pigmentiphaga litoralis]